LSRAKLILYRAALKECFPELEITQIKYLSEGWDSVACLVNRHLIFRFPKREEVSIFLEKELALLPELASKVPVPIPQFTYRAIEGGRTFPFGFAGYEMLRGRALSDGGSVKLGLFWAHCIRSRLKGRKSLGYPKWATGRISAIPGILT
jgi:hypothetical protein